MMGRNETLPRNANGRWGVQRAADSRRVALQHHRGLRRMGLVKRLLPRSIGDSPSLFCGRTLAKTVLLRRDGIRLYVLRA